MLMVSWEMASTLTMVEEAKLALPRAGSAAPDQRNEVWNDFWQLVFLPPSKSDGHRWRP